MGGRLCCKKPVPAEAAESGYQVVSSPSSQTGASDYPSPTQLHFLGRGSCFSDAQSCPTLCDPMDCSTPDLPVHHQIPRSLPKLMSIESVMSSNHLILCHPLFLPPSILPSIGVFSNESALSIRWSKYWSSSFSIILPMNVRAKSLQSCPTLCESLDCSLPGSSIHGTLQPGALEWVVTPSSRGSSRPRARIRSSCTSCAAGGFLTAEPSGGPSNEYSG